MSGQRHAPDQTSHSIRKYGNTLVYTIPIAQPTSTQVCRFSLTYCRLVALVARVIANSNSLIHPAS